MTKKAHTVSVTRIRIRCTRNLGRVTARSADPTSTRTPTATLTRYFYIFSTLTNSVRTVRYSVQLRWFLTERENQATTNDKKQMTWTHFPRSGKRKRRDGIHFSPGLSVSPLFFPFKKKILLSLLFLPWELWLWNFVALLLRSSTGQINRDFA